MNDRKGIRSERAVSPIGIIAGLAMILVGLVMFTLGYFPGLWSPLEFHVSASSIFLDIGGIGLIALGGFVAWRV